MNEKKKHQQRKIGESMKVSSLVLGILVFSLSFMARADVNVSATVDRNALNPDDTLTLTLTVDATEEVEVGQPNLPSLGDFEILNQWTGQSQRATMVQTAQGPQFQRQSVTQFNYMLMPKGQGQLKIGPAEVNVSGKTYRTKTIAVTVAPGAGVQAQPKAPTRQHGRGQGVPPPPTPPSAFDQDDEDLFAQLLRRQFGGNARNVPGGGGGARTLPVNPEEAFFIQVETDKTDVYVGEQVTTSFYIYTRGILSDLDTIKYPALRGFWKEDIEIATHLNFSDEVVNGIPYKKALLASFALFPIKEGSATVDPYQARCSVVASNGFGLGKAYTFTKASQPVKITVRPLPLEGRPSDFSGAVGDFEVSARVDDRNVVEGQPLTLKIRFEGRGNAKPIELPPFQPPEGMEIYDTQNEAKFYRTGLSFKEFKVLLIPRREGDFTIPSMTVSVFSPTAKKYMQKTTFPISLRVGKNPNGKSMSGPSLSLGDGESKVSDKQKKTIEPQLIVAYRPESRLPRAVSFLIWIAVFAGVGAVLAWRAREEMGWGQKKKDLMRQLKTRLKRVEEKAASGDWRGVGTDMTNTAYFVLGEITGEGGAHMEVSKLLLKVPPSVRQEVGEALAKQMDVFQVLTFAPEGAVGQLKEPEQLKKAVKDMEQLLTKAVALGLASSQEEQQSLADAFTPPA